MSANVETIRHSASHVMAEAVLKLYPGTKLGIGPAIDDGFYYDFQFARPLLPEELPAIEKEMRRIIASGAEFVRKEVSKEEARALFAEQPFKLELIEALEGTISTYEQDGFLDLCRGPHVATTREIRPDAFKLRSIAGAYWHGDEKLPMLTRIYAYAFVGKAELEAHLKMLEEAPEAHAEAAITALSLHRHDARLVERARRAALLDAATLDRLAAATDRLIVADVPTLERCGGGSVRCMLAEVPR